MNFDLDLQPIFIREKIIKLCRAYFDDQNFHEVIPSVLNEAIPSEATLFPFTTEWKTNQENKTLFLSISPESSLKKMLAVGMGNAYAIGKCFRNLEAAGHLHQPEFLMLEWYRLDANMDAIVKDVKGLLNYISDELFESKKKNTSFNWSVLSLNELFKKYLGTEIADVADFQKLIELAQKKNYSVHDANWEQLFNQLFLNEVEPYLPKSPFFLIDFPAKISPLCKPKKENPYLAERFEFYLNGVEVGNGNEEQTDSEKVSVSFSEVQKNRHELHQTSSPIDEEFLAALKKLKGKQISGIGLGIDRLAMFFAEQSKITSVEPFSLSHHA